MEHVLDTAQEVVDFILGYSVRQQEIGFSFENVIEGSNAVENWSKSQKSFYSGQHKAGQLVL